MSRIRLTSSATVTITSAGVLLCSDLGTFQLDGADVKLFVSKIVPLLDGTLDRAAVAEALEGYSAESVHRFLLLLEQRGLVEEVDGEVDSTQSEMWRGQREFFRKWNVQPEAVSETLGRARVLVAGLEPWGALAAIELAAAGVEQIHLLDDREVVPSDLISMPNWGRQHLGQRRAQATRQVISTAFPWCNVTTATLTLTEDHRLALAENKWDLIVCAVARDEMLVLRSMASFAQAAKIPSLYGHLDGLNAVLGPVVVPGETACWNCCRLRLLANSDYFEADHALQAELLLQRPGARTHTYLGPMTLMLGHMLSLEALKLLTRYTASTLPGRLLIQNLVTLETSVHAVIQMPWCDICGGAVNSNSSLDGSVAEKKTESASGLNPLSNINTPEEFRRLMAGWVDERTGIIRHLIMGTAEATDPELPITSAAVLSNYTDGHHHSHGTEIGSGKGITTIEAMIGAVGEAIERYSAARYRAEDILRSSFNDLAGDKLDPRQLCLYAEEQYADPEFPYDPFNPSRPMDWIRGWWADTGKPVWVPALPAYFNYHAHRGESFCQVTSNGLAAGSSIEDASLRAIFELVERDAFMLTWLCRRSGKRILLDDRLAPEIAEVVRQIEEKGVKVELYSLSAGLSIPVVMCLGIGDGKDWPGVTVALAAHANPRIAVRKAILEQGHVGPYIRRLMQSGEHPIPENPEDVRTLTEHALFYAPTDRTQIFDFIRCGSDVGHLAEGEEFAEFSLRHCVQKIVAAGVRIALVDVTSPDVARGPFRVTRALGTNMQLIDFGFKLRRLGNPRLRTMLTGPLNPYPHPLA